MNKNYDSKINQIFSDYKAMDRKNEAQIRQLNNEKKTCDERRKQVELELRKNPKFAELPVSVLPVISNITVQLAKCSQRREIIAKRLVEND